MPHPKKSAAFWVSASTAIGGGHLMRCLCLADTLAQDGAACTFFVNSEAQATVAALARTRHRVIVAAHDAPAVLAAAKEAQPQGFDWFIIDDYRLDARSETPLRAVANRIMVIDDLANRRHDCDLLLDSVLGRAASDYDGLLDGPARFLTGADHALLRPEFARARGEALARRKTADTAATVLISFGLMDPGGIAEEAVANLQGLGLRLHVVLGQAAQSLPALRTLGRENIELLIDPPSMSALMRDSDIALGAGGSTAWERACLGLPAIAIVLADNQAELAKAFEKRGALVAIARDDAVWAQAKSVLARLAADDNYRREMSVKAAQICDGLGAARVALQLLPQTDQAGAAITLRKAVASDAEIIFAWQTEPDARRYSTNPEPPAHDQHLKWMQGKLADPGCVLNIVERDGLPVGVLRFDRRLDYSFMTSILISGACAGQGVATAALEAGKRLLRGQHIWAVIDDHNAGSRKAFSKAGFLPQGNGRYLFDSVQEVAS